MEVGSLEAPVHYRQRQRLHGKRAVVTGAASGIGRAIALRFAVALPPGWTPIPTRRSCSEFGKRLPAGWQKHLGSRTLQSSSPAMRRVLSTGQFIRRTAAGLFDERSKVICSLSVSRELSEIICRLMK